MRLSHTEKPHEEVLEESGDFSSVTTNLCVTSASGAVSLNISVLVKGQLTFPHVKQTDAT